MRLSLAVVAISIALAGPLAAQEPVYRVGEGTAAPKLLHEVKPEYPPSAMFAAAQGVVTLECVVGTDGGVTDIKVTRPLHAALDEAAAAALAKWRFLPGTREGKAVAVRVDVEISFALRDAPQERKGPPLGSPDVLKKEDGVVMPTVVKDVKPTYTAQAMRDGAQGSVKMEAVVLPDGTVGDVRVTQRLNPDLDEQALRAIRQWTFKPGTKDGVAVPVQVDVEMTFTLRSGPKKLGAER
jgi:protein TonB